MDEKSNEILSDESLMLLKGGILNLTGMIRNGWRSIFVIMCFERVGFRQEDKTEINATTFES